MRPALRTGRPVYFGRYEDGLAKRGSNRVLPTAKSILTPVTIARLMVFAVYGLTVFS